MADWQNQVRTINPFTPEEANAFRNRDSEGLTDITLDFVPGVRLGQIGAGLFGHGVGYGGRKAAKAMDVPFEPGRRDALLGAGSGIANALPDGTAAGLAGKYFDNVNNAFSLGIDPTGLSKVAKSAILGNKGVLGAAEWKAYRMAKKAGDDTAEALGKVLASEKVGNVKRLGSRAKKIVDSSEILDSGLARSAIGDIKSGIGKLENDSLKNAIKTGTKSLKTLGDTGISLLRAGN